MQMWRYLSHAITEATTAGWTCPFGGFRHPVPKYFEGQWYSEWSQGKYGTSLDPFLAKQKISIFCIKVARVVNIKLFLWTDFIMIW